MIDLRTGRPDPALFPLREWRRCVTDALHAAPPGYGNVAGLPELRRALAVWISRSRGVRAQPEEVVVTAGAQQAFDLIAQVMLAPGDWVAVENPGYAPARHVLELRGLKVVPVPVDDEGIVVEQIPTRARAVFVTPSHQAPSGVTMTARRRHALLRFAQERQAVVVEDDYDTEFRYVDRPLEPIQRLDGAGRVLYVGTFSKTLSPSLRLGFVVAPVPIAAALAAAQAITTQPPHLTQAALAELIAGGGLDRHLRRARRDYALRHAAVQRHLDALHARGAIEPPVRSNAGLHSVLTLPDGVDAHALVARLRARRIAVDTTDEWWMTAHPQGLVLGFGLATIAQLDMAFDALDQELPWPVC